MCTLGCYLDYVCNTTTSVTNSWSTGLSLGFTSHLNHISFWRCSSQPISWLSTEKVTLIQQKQTCIHNNIQQHKINTRAKARFPVWTRPGSDTARRTSLARHPRPGVFQAGSNSSPVSERLHTAVLVGLLRSSHRCRHSAAPAFRQLSTTCSTSLPAQHLRPSGLFSCRLHSLEVSPGFHLGTRPSVQTLSNVCLKRTCLLDTSAFSGLEVIDDNRAL